MPHQRRAIADSLTAGRPGRASRVNRSARRARRRARLPKSAKLIPPLVWSRLQSLLALLDRSCRGADEEGRRPRRAAPARKAPVPSPDLAPLTRVPATMVCPSELGVGVKTKRRYCDVLSGRVAQEGRAWLTNPAAPTQDRPPCPSSSTTATRIPPTSKKKKQAYRHYTATIGVLTMDNTLVQPCRDRSEFRAERDLFDRIGGGAGPGGVKAVAPTGSELVQFTIEPMTWPRSASWARSCQWFARTATISSPRPGARWRQSATC